MFKWLGKRNGAAQTAVCVDVSGAALAELRWDGGKAQLRECRFQPATPEGPDVALQQLVRHTRPGEGCAGIMPLGSYSLLLIEAPEVPPDELRAAVRWRVRDLIDFHIDDAVLDVFDAPASAARGQTHLYAVVSRTSEVKGLADRLQDAGVDLAVIDIPELALRNIAAQLPEDAQGVAILYFGAQRGLIALCRNGTLYLARTLDVGQERLLAALTDGHTEALYDALALEVQRSLDYFDRTFQQAPIGNLLVAPAAAALSGLVESLRTNVGLPARILELAEVVEGADKLPPDPAGACLLAIGGALRRETKRL